MYTKTYYITSSDMDVNYRLTPHAALLYFQDCFASYLAHYNIAAFDILKDGKFWVISDFDLHFTGKRAMWLDKVEVSISFSELTSCRAYILFKLINANTGEEFANGESCWVTLDFKTRRPCNIQEILSKANAQDLGVKHRGKVNPHIENPVFIQDEIHKVNASDLDFNGHVCNRSYLIMAMATLSIDFIQKNSPEHLHIKFLKESFITDTLHINQYKDALDGLEFFHDIRNDEDKVICTIYSQWKEDSDELSKDVATLVHRN